MTEARAEPKSFDVVVVGTGVAGMTAAIVAATNGLEVLLLESTDRVGGTTALSGGGVWIPNNPYMNKVGLSDSIEQARTYLAAVLGNYFDTAKVDAFLTAGPEMLRFMQDHSEVRFDPGNTVDYEPDKPGVAYGRTIAAQVFDGRRLGEDIKLLRPALKQLGAFDGMQIGAGDIAAFSSVLRKPKSLVYSAGKFARYLSDRLFHGRATRLVNGNALSGSLLCSVRRAGVTLWTSSPMRSLIQEDGAIRGVRVSHQGLMVEVTATRGVILATGGYGANTEMRRTYVPQADAGFSLQPEGSQGDGIKAGVEAGGTFVTGNVANAIYVPMSTMVDRTGERFSYPHIMWDRHMPGFIVVDKTGKRFVNESTSYQAFGTAMIEKGVESAWLIGTHHAIRRYSMGLAKAAPLPIKPYLANGYLKKGKTLSNLADVLGLPKAAFLETVSEFNRHAKEGKDPEFDRGVDAYSIGQGDPEHKINPNLAPLDRGPFYAVELFPGQLSTMNGLDTDEHARVLDGDRRPIPGLYAAGVDANSLFRGTYPGGGGSLGPGMTFGYIAAQHLSGRT
ncbi:FAD-dependent oxidoreductase [Sphingomonas sp. LY54]|uniref:FAD-dependent oxidoreductase n=1 Tax=Sphingomonas sp. LY54 TaxID=3095343 RepID=UPI002D76EDDF|nr:FAD-dependent oxidoreductase [Sphingomonas sp. LY54]WRP28727.1 FAD-dependent oxidoreductase [Sphingomonas sp. LY54]